MSTVLNNMNMENLITEDDEPVDNIFSEKQQRLLGAPLYKNWNSRGRRFLALANVGIFDSRLENKVIVPDVFLSMDVSLTKEKWIKEHKSYIMAQFKKAPEIVIEIVSNTIGAEEGKKKQEYAALGVRYYVVFDPMQEINKQVLSIYQLDKQKKYQAYIGAIFPGIGLGLKLWEGIYEDKSAFWLRWVDEQGKMIPTGDERADVAEERAELAEKQSAKDKERAELAEKQSAKDKEYTDKMAAMLRQMGIDPSKL